MEPTAKSIAQLLGDKGKIDNNARLRTVESANNNSNNLNPPPPTTVPEKKVAVEINYSKAWECLNGASKSEYPKTLICMILD